MKFISVKEFSAKWNVPERTARNYCNTGKIKGAFLTGKTWNIPEDATLPQKENQKKISHHILLNTLKEQKDMKLKVEYIIVPK
jgi:predicted site-specific integrase-resolvase